MTFKAPEYTCRHPVFPTWSNIDIMYDEVNKNECNKLDWYVYLSYITNNGYHSTFDCMHGG